MAKKKAVKKATKKVAKKAVKKAAEPKTPKADTLHRGPEGLR